MTPTSKRRSPRATVSKIAIEKATLVLQQLPAKPNATPKTLKTTTQRSTRNSVQAPARSAKMSLATALSKTAIADKKAFLNRKINDVISVLLDDAPPKAKKKARKKK